MYYYGLGTAEDHAEALKWYYKAAKLGHAEAQKAVKELGY
jgi:TPR repeat protein